MSVFGGLVLVHFIVEIRWMLIVNLSSKIVTVTATVTTVSAIAKDVAIATAVAITSAAIAFAAIATLLL